MHVWGVCVCVCVGGVCVCMCVHGCVGLYIPYTSLCVYIYKGVHLTTHLHACVTSEGSTYMIQSVN